MDGVVKIKREASGVGMPVGQAEAITKWRVENHELVKAWNAWDDENPLLTDGATE